MKVATTNSVSTVLVVLALASGPRHFAHAQEPAANLFKAESLLIVRPSITPMIGPVRKTDVAENRVFAQTQKVLLKSPFVLTAALRQPGMSELSLIKQQDEPLDWLAESIQVEFIDDSQILRVSLIGEEPREVKIIVDAVVEAYLNEIAQSEKTEVAIQLATLRNERRSHEKKIREKAEIVHRLAQEIGSSDSDQIRLSRELVFHELKQLVNRRERLTTQLDDISTELHVLETLSAENADSNEHDLRKQMRALTLRREHLTGRVDALKADIGEKQREIRDRVGFSADLEIRRSELESLQKVNTEIAELIAQLELKSKDRDRVERVQPAFVTTIDRADSEDKVPEE